MPSPRLPADTGVVHTSRGAAFLVPPREVTQSETPSPAPPASRRERPSNLRPSRRGRVGRTIYFPADLIALVDHQCRHLAAQIPGGVGKTAFYIACVVAGLEDGSRIEALLRTDPQGLSLAAEFLRRQSSRQPEPEVQAASAPARANGSF